jgi:hypothetical protein
VARELTPTELYTARKLGSKLTRAVHALNEARTAAGALGQDVLRELGIAHFFPEVTSLQARIQSMRDAVRDVVPAAEGTKSWERSQ